MNALGDFTEPVPFVTFQTTDVDLFRFAAGITDGQEIKRGMRTHIIHARSHFDDLAYGGLTNRPGEEAFYEVLNEAYVRFRVIWVCFVYYPAEAA